MADIHVGKFINNLDTEDLTSEKLQGVVNNVYAKAISTHKKKQKEVEDRTKEQEDDTVTFVKSNHDRLKAHKNKPEKDLNKDDAPVEELKSKSVEESKKQRSFFRKVNESHDCKRNYKNVRFASQEIEKKGYSHAEANDIALKLFDDIEGDTQRSLEWHLEKILPKEEFDKEYYPRNESLNEDYGDIQRIGHDEAYDIIDNHRPRGSFLTREGNKFVAIDNLTGDAWVEEFDTEVEAIKWLRYEEDEAEDEEDARRQLDKKFSKKGWKVTDIGVADPKATNPYDALKKESKSVAESKKTVGNKKLTEAKTFQPMTLREYGKKFLDGYLDIDVYDNEIDMGVAFVFDCNKAPKDYYEKFLSILANNVMVVDGLNDEWNFLTCDFSGFYKPYNKQINAWYKKNGGHDEFEGDEGYYDLVLATEGLVSGYYSEEDYKELCDIFTSKKNLVGESLIKESAEKIQPGNIYSVLVKELPAEDIDHHYSDLYVRKTPKSTEIVNRLTTKSLLSTFKDNIDGDIWYELPFCYVPYFGESKTPYGGTTIEDYVNVNFSGSKEDKNKLIAKMKEKADGSNYFNGLNMSVKDWKKAGEEFGLTMKSYPVTESKKLEESAKSWVLFFDKDGQHRAGSDWSTPMSVKAPLAKQRALNHKIVWPNDAEGFIVLTPDHFSGINYDELQKLYNAGGISTGKLDRSIPFTESKKLEEAGWTDDDMAIHFVVTRFPKKNEWGSTITKKWKTMESAQKFADKEFPDDERIIIRQEEVYKKNPDLFSSSSPVLVRKEDKKWYTPKEAFEESKKLTEAPKIDSYEKGNFKAYYGTSKDEYEDSNKPYYSNLNLFDKNGEVIGSFGYSRFEDEKSAKKDFEKKKKAIDRSLGKTQLAEESEGGAALSGFRSEELDDIFRVGAKFTLNKPMTLEVFIPDDWRYDWSEDGFTDKELEEIGRDFRQELEDSEQYDAKILDKYIVLDKLEGAKLELPAGFELTVAENIPNTQWFNGNPWFTEVVYDTKDGQIRQFYNSLPGPTSIARNSQISKG